jgi:glycerol-3-phosphate acyltransferase PlsY
MTAERWPARRQAAVVATAAAVGCLPTARLVTRAVAGADIEQLGDGKPGAANVRQTIGLGPALFVMGVDVAKGYTVGAWARRRGANAHLVGAASLAPVLTHVAVAGGQGAATALGASFAMDTPVMVAVGVPLVLGTLAKHHAVSVILAAFALGPVRWAWRRDPAAGWALGIAGVLTSARLRGPRGSAQPLSPRTAWSRFWLDRDP